MNADTEQAAPLNVTLDDIFRARARINQRKSLETRSAEQRSDIARQAACARWNRRERAA